MFDGQKRELLAQQSAYYNGTQQRLAKLRNELQAIKAGSKLAYSSVLFPENVPEQGWNGAVVADPSNPILAAFTATFTRNDGLEITPLVDFTFDYDGPTTADWVRQQGGTASGRDLKAELDDWVSCYIVSTSEKSVSYRIEFQNNWPDNSINLSLTVRAISPVSGLLKLERVL